jgi:RNA polymerase sigma-70 factor (ECF subfamily)
MDVVNNVPTPDPQMDTLQMHRCVERWQAGDRAAADELLRAVGTRLEDLARKMLRGFPNVRGWAETADVLQRSVLSLLSTLQKQCPDSTRHFFNLAAVHVRRELLDLARRFSGKDWTPLSDVAEIAEDRCGGRFPTAERAGSAEDLELWCRFHQAVEELPPEEREVVSLAFYHGWTHEQIAELSHVDERTVRRRWRAACRRLNRRLGGQFPQT